jgi:hypothetical protein
MIVVWLINFLLERMNLSAPVDPETVNTVAQFIVAIVGALLIRARVFSRNTIREAGLSPKAVQERADNPAVPKLVGP